MTLIARDEGGNEGKSDPVEITLPQKPFLKPLARALAEQRRNLVLAPDDKARVANALDALMIAPDIFATSAGSLPRFARGQRSTQCGAQRQRSRRRRRLSLANGAANREWRPFRCGTGFARGGATSCATHCSATLQKMRSASLAKNCAPRWTNFCKNSPPGRKRRTGTIRQPLMAKPFDKLQKNCKPCSTRCRRCCVLATARTPSGCSSNCKTSLKICVWPGRARPIPEHRRCAGRSTNSAK